MASLQRCYPSSSASSTATSLLPCYLAHSSITVPCPPRVRIIRRSILRALHFARRRSATGAQNVTDDASASLSFSFPETVADGPRCFQELNSGTLPAAAPCVGLLEDVDKGITKLECMLSAVVEQETCDSDSYSTNLRHIQSKLDTLNIEYSQMKALLDSRENALNIALHETECLKTDLGNANLRISSLNVYKEENDARQMEEVSNLESSTCRILQILDRHAIETQTLKNTEETVRNVQRSILLTDHNSLPFKVIEVLQKDADLSFQALASANEELNHEKVASRNLLLKWNETAEELKEKSSRITELSQELADTKHISEKVTEKLSRAQEEVLSLKQKLVSAEQALEKEKKSLAAAREGLETLEKALEDEGSKAEDLFKEISSLKVQMEEKEKIVENLTQEAIKNKGLKETNLDALHRSEERVDQLVAQCDALENQLRLKEALLQEIKEDTVKSAESLRIAAQIKKDLNDSRQHEVELRQRVDGQASYIEELKQQLKENSRALRAELALRQAEKSVQALTTQVNILRKGMQSKDEAIKLMQDRLDGNIHILKSASSDREAMKKMQVYIAELESQVAAIGISRRLEMT